MKTLRVLTLAPCVVALLAFGCKRNDLPKTESDSTTKTTTPAGTQETKTSTEKVGDTQVTEQQTTTKTDAGTVKQESDTVVGTVSKYELGKEIEITTADNDHHSFDLDEKDLVANVASDVAVGARVKLVQSKDDNGHKTITVTVGG